LYWYNGRDMEAVVFEGKEYVKASVLAEKFRYTQDYLGQLCRGKKVDARLVGRAWYINLASLELHRTGRYKPLEKSVDSVPVKKASNNYSSRIDVEPFLKNKTVKILKGKNGVLTEVPVRYERDEYSLIPRVNKAAISAYIPILPAEAERLKIKKEAKHFNVTDFKAQPLPEVFLSGSIKVDGIPEVVESTEEPIVIEEEKSSSDITNKIKTERMERPQRMVSLRQPQRKMRPGTALDMKPVVREMSASVAVKVPVQVPKNIVSIRKPSTIRPVALTSRPQVAVSAPSNAKVAPREIKFSPDVVIPKNISEVQVSGRSDFLLIFFVLLGACALSFVVLSTTQELVVGEGNYANNFSFDTENISILFDRFFR
jgi:hypothetical protein